MPGCGKTTIIKKIVEDLRKRNVANVVGFYTQEVRGDDGERIGFDIHLLDGRTQILARIGYLKKTYIISFQSIKPFNFLKISNQG